MTVDSDNLKVINKEVVLFLFHPEMISSYKLELTSLLCPLT